MPQPTRLQLRTPLELGRSECKRARKADAAKDAARVALDHMEAFLREHISEASDRALTQRPLRSSRQSAPLWCAPREVLFALGEGSEGSEGSAAGDRWHLPLGTEGLYVALVAFGSFWAKALRPGPSGGHARRRGPG